MPSTYAPKRVVTLQPSATVILDSIGQLDRVVACTKYCADVCDGVRNSARTVIADSWTADAQEILSALPDIVIAAVPYQEKAVAEILRAGVPFLGLAPRSLADIYTDIALISGIMGVSEKGDDVIARMADEIEAVRHRYADRKRIRVFCEEWGKPLIASQRWVAELVKAAGGEFIGAPGAQISAEQVLAEAPNIFIASWCGAGERVPLDKIVRERGWQSMRAVRDRRVYCVRDEFLNTPAPTLLQGLYALVAAIHPDEVARPMGLRWIGDEVAPTAGAKSNS